MASLIDISMLRNFCYKKASKLIDGDDKHFNTVPIKHLLQQPSENNFIQVCEALHFALANLCCKEKMKTKRNN